MHELGHQVAEQSHYGDCSNYMTFTSFNPTLPGGPVECITGWDVMGQSPTFSDFSAYSKVSRGIFDLADVPSFDVISGPPFSRTYILNPVEVAPTPANPDLIRLSIGAAQLDQIVRLLRHGLDPTLIPADARDRLPAYDAKLAFELQKKIFAPICA